MNEETSKNEILEAINAFSTHVDEKFNAIDGRFIKIESEIGWIKSNMVTKDFLDDKMADLRGDLVVLMRKEDTKLKFLVETLERKNILSTDEVKRIYSMEPFPQLAL